MFVRQSILRKKLRSLALSVFYSLENDGNCDFETNGEKLFVNNAFRYFKENVSGGAVVFDVGAHLGKYSRIILDKSAETGCPVKLHIFEPTRSCVEVLGKMFSGSNSVALNGKAVSNVNGRADIFYDKSQSSLASLHKRNLKAYSREMGLSEAVETVRLDNYIKENRVEHINLLKIAVEGHEMTAFEGMGSYLDGRFVDFVQFEYGGANLDSHTSLMDFFELFEGKGFRMAKVMPGGLEIRFYEPCMDNFQYANYVAVSGEVMGRLI